MEDSRFLGNGTVMVDDLLPYLMEIAGPWLQEQRNLYIADSRPLSGDERAALRDYYDDRILDKVRVAAVDRISNPSFYSDLKASGNPVLDISGAAGIALIDCIVVKKALQRDFSSWISLLFHELVHVVQFDILGPRRHLELYLRGWAENDFQYHSIPFEVQARKLEARFNRREPPFSVREVIRRDLADMSGTL